MPARTTATKGQDPDAEEVLGVDPEPELGGHRDPRYLRGAAAQHLTHVDADPVEVEVGTDGQHGREGQADHAKPHALVDDQAEEPGRAEPHRHHDAELAQALHDAHEDGVEDACGDHERDDADHDDPAAHLHGDERVEVGAALEPGNGRRLGADPFLQPVGHRLGSAVVGDEEGHLGGLVGGEAEHAARRLDRQQHHADVDAGRPGAQNAAHAPEPATISPSRSVAV